MKAILNNRNIFLWLFLLLLASCNKVDNNELWREKYNLDDGTHIFIYHSATCERKKPLFVNKEKMIEFMFLKYDVLHSCIYGDDEEMLEHISKRNIRKFIWYSEFHEDEQEREYNLNYENVIDTSERDKHSIFYAYKNNEGIVDIDSNYRDIGLWLE